MADTLNPAVKVAGKKLIILYDTADDKLKNKNQVTMSLVPAKDGVIFRFQGRTETQQHESGIVPGSVIGSLGQKPSIEIIDGNVKVTYQSNQPIGDIKKYF